MQSCAHAQRPGATCPVLPPSRAHRLPVLLVVWYIACIPLNAVVAEAKIAAAGGGLAATLNESWNHHAARHSGTAPDRR